MKTTTCSKSRSFKIEPLEGRRLLNGAVTATLQGSDLVVRGDSGDNQILITQTTPGTFHIAGLEGTTINGKSSADVAKVTADLNIQMSKGGEDHVSIQGAVSIPDDLRAKMGKGELVIEGSAGTVEIGDELNVRSGSKGDVTLRNDVHVRGNTTINSGGVVSAAAGLANVPDFSAAKFSHPLDINNPYQPTVVGSKYTYEDKATDDETGETSTATIIVEVLDQTKTVAGVKTRTVRDHLVEDGRTVEDTFDQFAQDDDGNVWYFGEDVTNYEYDDNGNLIDTNHEGTWTAGVDGAQAGVSMEANPRVGFVYQQEFAPGQVLDQGVGLATDETATVPLGTFDHLFKTKDISVAQPFSLENKFYAPGIGTLSEVDLDLEDHEVIETTQLVSLTLNGKAVTQVVPTTGFAGTNPTYRKTLSGLRLDNAATINAKGAIYFGAGTVADGLTVHGGAEVILVDATLNGHSPIFSNDNISLSHVTVTGSMFAGGDPDLDIFNSNINAFKGRFGAGNNSIAATGSKFGSLDIDGRAGTNTLKDRSGNNFGTTTLRHFVRA